MFLRVWEKKGVSYASVVRTFRDGKKVNSETVLYIGRVEEEQIPYLKAAYSSDKPKLVYKDGTVYDPAK